MERKSMLDACLEGDVETVMEIIVENNSFQFQ